MNVPSPSEKKKIQQFGKILVDFANAAAVDDACFHYFKNIQNLYSFSAAFAERIETIFPSLNVLINSLVETERKLLELMLEEKTIIVQANKQFAQIGYSLEGYDAHNGTLMLLSLSWERGGLREGENSEAGQIDDDNKAGFLQAMKLLGVTAVDGPISVRMDLIKDEIKNAMAMDTWERLNQLMEIGRKIDEMQSAVPELRYTELRTYSEQQPEISNLHKMLEKIQSDIREIMDSVIGGCGLKEVPAFVNFLKIYNSIQTGKLIIRDDGSLTPHSPIFEKKYFAVDGIEEWFDVLLDDVAYCMIEYFKLDKSSRYVRKCPQCDRYFLVTRPGRQKYCKTACRREWHKMKSA